MPWKLKFIIIWVLNSIREFEWNIENKTILLKRSLDDQERYLALEMLTREMTHARREGKNIPAKQYQGKAWATKAQQDWPVNIAINNQLLVCKG
jgi:hypothetical protein